MLPTDSAYGNWAASGEIDILEMRGQETSIVQSTLHYGGTWPNNVFDIVDRVDLKTDMSADFHIYACEWEEKEIRFYTDAQLVGTRNLDK
jgi:beta-glucanase (GH16 family)